MLQLYDVSKTKIGVLMDYRNIRIEHEINEKDILLFDYPISKEEYSSITKEGYVRTKTNEYVIKEINTFEDDWSEIVSKVNVEDIEGRAIIEFTATSQTCSAAVALALAGTGWTYEDNTTGTKLRTVKLSICTAYQVLKEIQDTFKCEMTYDALNKKVYIYDKMGMDRGVYFSEQLNLQTMTIQSNSYDYITRLIPIGKDDLYVTDVNNGKNYIENYQYSNKIITGFWEDNRYTDALQLLEDGTSRLDYLSKPYAAYKASIIDLAKNSNEYELLDFGLGDTITLLAKSKNTKESQRIIKYVEYLDEATRNTCELANKIPNLEYLDTRYFETAEVVDSVTTSNGSIDGTKVDGIDWSKVTDINILTAQIQDAAITSAKIGDLAVTTAKIGEEAVTTSKIEDAAITSAKIGDLEVNDAKIASAAITETKIGFAAVSEAKIADLAVTNAKIANLAVDAAKIAELAVGTAKIQNGAINSLKVADAAILSAKIADLAVVSAKIADLAVGTGKIDDLAVTNAKIADLAVGTAKIALGAITTALIADAAIGTVQIADGSITDAKIVDRTANKITTGTLDAGEIDVVNLNAANITVGTINGQQIAEGAIDTANIAANAIIAEKIRVSSITGDKLVVDAITAREIAAASISGNEIAANTITAANLAVGTITAASGIIADLDASVITTGTLVGDRILGGTLQSLNEKLKIYLDTGSIVAKAGLTVTGDEVTDLMEMYLSGSEIKIIEKLTDATIAEFTVGRTRTPTLVVDDQIQMGAERRQPYSLNSFVGTVISFVD